MKFDDKYFNNEVRDGFFVCSLMKRAWAAQIEVLLTFDEICRKNNLRYFADFGTLLGAVRHKGFIPWDDDIDICMLRDDVIRLREILGENNCEGYRYSNVYNREDFPMQLERFTTDSVIFGKDNMVKRHGFPFIAGIDVFPLDYLPNDKKERERFSEDINIISVFLKSCNNNKGASIPKRIIELADLLDCDLKDRNKIINQTRILYDKYSALYLSEKGEEVAVITEWMNNPQKKIKKEFYNDTSYLQFENITIPVPKDFDEVLKMEYGDYMTPILASDPLHEYPFYRKQEKFIYENNNVIITEFDYKKLNKANQLTQYDYISTIKEYVDLIKKALNILVSTYTSGRIDKLTEIHTSIQDIVIKLGSKLENQYRPEVVGDSIAILERYCDLLYEAENNASGANYLDYLKNLLEGWGEIKTCIDGIIQKERIYTVAFIIDKTEDWILYEKIFKFLNDKAGFECYIIPVPYYHRNDEWELEKDNEVYEGIEGDYQVIDYKEFDFSNIVFDCVIKSNAYDEFSFGDTIHPFFYTAEIKKSFARKVIHIPTFETMDFTAEDSRMVYMANYYVKTPSVMLSDYIILKSETIRQRYLELLNEASEENWGERIIALSNAEDIKDFIIQKCME